MKIRKEAMEKIKLTFKFVDGWDRAVFQGDNGRMYVTTDLVRDGGWSKMSRASKEYLLHSLHSRTQEGEPDSPCWKEGKFIVK